MRSHRPIRLVAPVLLGIALSLLTGCSDTTSPAARAWERAVSRSRPMPRAEAKDTLVASDGLGNTVFAPETARETPQGRSTYAHVPGE